MSTSTKNLSHNRILRTYIGHRKSRSLNIAYLQVSEVHTVLRVVGLAQEEVPKTEFTSPRFEVFDNRNNGLPATLVVWELCVGYSQSWPNFLLQAESASAHTSIVEKHTVWNLMSFANVSNANGENLSSTCESGKCTARGRSHVRTIAHEDGEVSSMTGCDDMVY